MSGQVIPTSVADWTIETVRRVVAEHPRENDWLEYKERLVPEIAKTVCAMLNTRGGYIILGVSDDREREDRLVGTDLSGDLRLHLNNLLKGIEPSLATFDDEAIRFALAERSGEGVWVVQLPTSDLRPHILEGRFYKRTPGGSNESMGAHEVRDQMILRETQLKRLEMLSLAFGQMQRTHDEMGRTSHPESVAARFDTDSLGFLIGETAGLLPPNLMRKLLHARHLAGCANRRFDWAQQAKALSEATGAKHKARYNLTTTEMGDLFNTLSECKRPLEDLVRSCLGKKG